MPHVRIVNTSGHAFGTSIEIDGVPVPRVRSVSFRASVGYGPNREPRTIVTLEIVPTSIEIDTPAIVTTSEHPADTADPDGYGHAV